MYVCVCVCTARHTFEPVEPQRSSSGKWFSCYLPWFLRQCLTQMWSSPNVLGWLAQRSPRIYMSLSPRAEITGMCNHVSFLHGFWKEDWSLRVCKVITFLPEPRHMMASVHSQFSYMNKQVISSWVLCNHAP